MLNYICRRSASKIAVIPAKAGIYALHPRAVLSYARRRGIDPGLRRDDKKNICFLAISLLLYGLPVYADTPVSKHADSKQPIQVNSDTLEVIQQQNIAIFRGNVIAVQGDTRIRSDVMTVHYAKKEGAAVSSSDPGQNKIQKIDVDGHVVVTNPTESASGDKGFYDVDRKQIYLFSNVVLTRGKNILKGDTLVYDLATEKSVVNSPFHKEEGVTNGRVRALFVPEKSEKPLDAAAPQKGAAGTQ